MTKNRKDQADRHGSVGEVKEAVTEKDNKEKIKVRWDDDQDKLSGWLVASHYINNNTLDDHGRSKVPEQSSKVGLLRGSDSSLDKKGETCKEEGQGSPLALKALNEFSFKSLKEIDDIGKQIADNIIEKRNELGGKFKCWDEVEKVTSVGPKTREKLEKWFLVRVNKATPPSPPLEAPVTPDTPERVQVTREGRNSVSAVLETQGRTRKKEKVGIRFALYSSSLCTCRWSFSMTFFASKKLCLACKIVSGHLACKSGTRVLFLTSCVNEGNTLLVRGDVPPA